MGTGLAVINIAIFACVAMVGSTLFVAMEEVGLAIPGEAGFPIAVLVVAWATTR